MRILPVLALLGTGAATQPTQTAQSLPAQQARPPIPYVVGERATYDVHYSMWFAKVGTGTMEVVSVDTVRGRDAYKFMLTVNGGFMSYKIRDTLISWVDTADFKSLRFVRDQEEGGKVRHRLYEIFPDRGVYTENGKAEKPTSADPLDDVSLLYFVRSQTLNVGENHTYERYFRPDRNPLRLLVRRRETVDVPAGKFKTIVVQPIIKAGGSGILSEKDAAEVWIADDSTRKVVQLKIRLNFGAITLKLKNYRATPAVPPQPGK
ncbi:MAG TPA: DUF3108 domain-containing protein [Gemmatimonadaceae bacterium]|nr:DUF3108 domain-containing protein [Gemmatimonadaceae bacterium]